MRLLCLFSLVLLRFGSDASSCGKSTIPFSFEALPNGQPVLGCARPTCFGRRRDGVAISSDASFYKVNQRPDGFVRKDAHFDANLPHSDAPHFAPQEADCESSYQSEMCGGDDQWVGGIGPLANPTGLPMGLKCCRYDSLRLSVDRGVAVVAPGQIVIGGEVFKERRQYAFDYISDVLKHTLDNGTVTYDVSVRRFPCLPVPDELNAHVGNEVGDEMLHRFDPKAYAESKRKVDRVAKVKPQKGTANPARAFQAPFFTPNAGPITGGGFQQGPPQSVIEGPFVSAQENIEQQETGPVLIQSLSPPVQQQYYPANSYYGGDGGGDGQWCFTGDTMVRTLNRGEIRMDQLRADDWVMSSDRKQLIYESVRQWVHRNPQQLANFYKLELADGTALKLTGKHFIYRLPCDGIEGKVVDHAQLVEQPQYAESVEAGDCVYKLALDQHFAFVAIRVVNVSVVSERGIYSPMTAGGDIVVNDIFASCHSVIASHALQETFFQLTGFLKAAAGYFFQAGKAIMTETTLELPQGTGLAAQLFQLVVGHS